jgi:hypothetical protein
MIVTATQIKFTHIFSFFHFLPFAFKISKQLNHIDGIVFFKLKGLKTITGWTNREAMLQFRNNGVHLDAMKNAKKIGLAKSVTWQTDTEPSWDEAKKRLIQVEF